MSLVQQGSHVAKNKVIKIPTIAVMKRSDSIVINKYADDAHVLTKMCPA